MVIPKPAMVTMATSKDWLLNYCVF
jgi:hypothetical protein